MLIAGEGKRSLPEWRNQWKGITRVVLALLASVTAALCMTGLTGVSAASAAPPPAGFALAWGANFHGQLGNGTTTDSTLPVRVHLPAGTRVTAVAADLNYGLALAVRTPRCHLS